MSPARSCGSWRPPATTAPAAPRSPPSTPAIGGLKKGLALTPVKFGISFTATFLNQAGALVHVYHRRLDPPEPRRHRDGPGPLRQGGAGGGRGIRRRLRPGEDHRHHTGKVPNTSPTAASSGSDLNGMAARVAAGEIKARLADFAAATGRSRSISIVFRDDRGAGGGGVRTLRRGRRRRPISPGSRCPPPASTRRRRSHWDRERHRPAVSSTSPMARPVGGDHRHPDRREPLDCGSTSCTTCRPSLNPAIDIGQIEGGFVQGMGWLTMEELVFDAEGG
jgi:xanthine dehydrogenase large subunit